MNQAAASDGIVAEAWNSISWLSEFLNRFNVEGKRQTRPQTTYMVVINFYVRYIPSTYPPSLSRFKASSALGLFVLTVFSR